MQTSRILISVLVLSVLFFGGAVYYSYDFGSNGNMNLCAPYPKEIDEYECVEIIDEINRSEGQEAFNCGEDSFRIVNYEFNDTNTLSYARFDFSSRETAETCLEEFIINEGRSLESVSEGDGYYYLTNIQEEGERYIVYHLSDNTIYSSLNRVNMGTAYELEELKGVINEMRSYE